jgi:hypothetical protein
MAHWSVTDEPGSPAAPEPAPAAVLSPIERVAEILDQLFLKEPSLGGAARRAEPRRHQALAKLSGSTSSPAEMPPAAALAAADTPSAELLPAKPGPKWSKPGVELIDLTAEPPR